LSNDEIGREQEYVAMLYGRLDDLREHASQRLAQSLRRQGGTHQARAERDADAAAYSDQLVRLAAVEHGLCFGRLDFHDGTRRYIGRLGIFDETADYEPLLVDWRAPAARPFYVATAASPEGARRRRYIKTSNRTVVGVDDEVLDLGSVDPSRHEGLTGEAALLAALSASRTGRMSDIVETIQAEQDRVIRSDLGGVLVVQGGPGTGKTAVALHRAAYLLYTHREQLAHRGVLIVGPNTTFLRYIEQVLPSLGETSVLLSTIADLYPGVRAVGSEPTEVAELKGRRVMAEFIAAAVNDRQRVPESVREIVRGDEVLLLHRAACEDARAVARLSRRPHNEAKQLFAQEVVDALARQIADRIGEDPFAGDPLGDDDAPGVGTNLLDESDVDTIRRELSEDDGVTAAIDELWPTLTPHQLVADLLSDADRLASAARGLLTEDEHRSLLRDHQEWTSADVALLDEAAELLGEDRREAAIRAERERRARVAEAQRVLDILAGSAAHELDDPDPEMLLAHDVVDAEELALRHGYVDSRTAAERAAADRTWAFGHVIVDEAQELSDMAWRMLMRRCPSRSMTVVGDLAQTGDLAGTSSWHGVLTPYVDNRWRLEALLVNYRVPAEVMTVAADVLSEFDPGLDPPRSVREAGVPPWQRRVPAAKLAGVVAEEVRRELAEVGDGRLAVLAPAERLDELRRVLGVGDDGDLENPVVVLDVKQAKGLEFDSVIVADPAGIIAGSSRGLNNLYVAVTRTTRRLGIVYSGALPTALKALG
jgi:DNA helicase IV